MDPGYPNAPYTSKTYIVCWDGSYANCLDIDRQLRDTGIDYLVMNVSSHDERRTNWMRASDVRYYGHFRNALRDFISTRHDVFVFNAGDVAWDDYAAYTRTIEELFDSDRTIGAFAPNMTNDVFSGDGSFILASRVHTGLFLATHTNGIYTSLSRPIAESVLAFMNWAEITGRIDWSLFKSGWGLDTVYCLLVICGGLKIYRDGSVLFNHPEGSSYDWVAADREMRAVTSAFGTFCEETGIDKENAQSALTMMYEKARTKQPVKVSDVYGTLLDGLVF